MRETSSEPELPAPARSRWRHLGRWVLVLCVGVVLYFGWRKYTDHRANRTMEAPDSERKQEELAIQTIEAMDYEWKPEDRAILARELARLYGRNPSAVPPPPDPATRPDEVAFFKAVHRLQPTVLKLVGNHQLHTQMRSLQDLKHLDSLKVLTISRLYQLENLNGLENHQSLQQLAIFGCDELQDLSALQGLKALEELIITGCENVQSLNGLQEKPALRRLNLSVSRFQTVDGLKGMPLLESLSLSSCLKLRDVSAIQGLTTLKHLYLKDCVSISKESMAALRAALPRAEIEEP